MIGTVRAGGSGSGSGSELAAGRAGGRVRQRYEAAGGRVGQGGALVTWQLCSVTARLPVVIEVVENRKITV